MINGMEEGGNLFFFHFRVIEFLIDFAVGVGAECDGGKKHVLNFLDQFHLFIENQLFQLILRDETELILFTFHQTMWLFFHFSVVNSSKKESFLHEFGALKLLDGFFIMDAFLKGYIGISPTHKHR